MKNIKSLILNLNPIDFVVVVFYLFLTILNIVFYTKLEYPLLFIAYNFLLIAFIVGLAYLSENKGNGLLLQLRYWYLFPLIFLTFKELYYLVYPIRQIDYDYILIQIDRFIFGGDPTVMLYSIANPILTELLQIVYGTFFFLPLILAIDLLVNKRYLELEYEAYIIVFGFLLSYLGYIFVPAIGPRFTLHNFLTNNSELPGLFLTDFLRWVVNSGESITADMVNAAEVVQRDVFPSGHTQMTILVMYLSVKMKTKSRYFFLVNGTLLVFSTVYLRYHYGIDVIGGIVFVFLTFLLGKPVYYWWKKITRKPAYKG